MQKLKRVVVTGLGAITPIGSNISAYWQGLFQGVSGAGPITHFDAAQHQTRFACELQNYHVDDYFERKEAKRLDPCTQYTLIACDEAIQDAGLTRNVFNPARLGVVWGTGIGGLKSLQEEIVRFIKGGMVPQFSPFLIPKMIANMPGAYIAIKYGFRGPNFTTVASCASAANALIDAVHFIQLGAVDIVISGGGEAAITEVGIGGFNAIKALSERNDEPKTASRPFDKHRDGFVLGEGAGALVLESCEHARDRGVPIYAELIGAGITSDAYHITASHPEGAGARVAIQQALQNAGIQPQAVDYINLHGTSTLLGDCSEIKAIEQAFGPHAYKLAMSATKSMTGHLLGAAGAIEAIATILALRHQLIPPTINHFTADEAFDERLNFTFNQAQPKPLNIAMSNTFGFGGHNTTIVLKRWED